MHLKLLTLKYCPNLDGFEDSPLRSFCANHHVVDVREEFFHHQGVPHWSFLIRYEPASVAAENQGAGAKGSQDWRELISEEQRPCFEALRTWRNERARQDGISAYIIATNRMLAEIALRRPATLESLKEIPGFGPSKLQNYGKDILALLNTSPAEEPTPATEEADAIPTS